MLTSSLTTVGARLRDEDGGIILAAAVICAAFVLLGAALVQVGDWLQHRRHVQVRADAAALAGGQRLGECFATSIFTPAQAETDIENTARQYAGFASPTGPTYNSQFGGGSDSVVFQSATYPGGGGGGPDDTKPGGPCSNLALDVKLTDGSIPGIFSFSPVGTTHAHARVELRSIRTLKGMFPLAIPDVNPKQVAVTFVDESSGGAELSGCTGAALAGGTSCTFLLTKGAAVNGLNPWSAPAGVKIPAAPGHLIGMRLGMGGQVASCAGTSGGATYACWDGGAVGRGILAIRSYATGGDGKQPKAPVLNGVWPAGICSGSPFFSTSSLTSGATSCGVGVQAQVDFGTGATDPTKAKAAGGVLAALTATVAGTTFALSPVSYNATANAWLWASAAGAATVPVDAAGSTSSYDVTMDWEEHAGTQGGSTCSSSGGNKCKGSFGVVQRVTSATDDGDGPVKLATLSEPSAPAMPPYSLTAGTHTLTVSVALSGSLGVTSPPVLQTLRLTGSGSRTTGVNCDGSGDSDFVASVINGCATAYQVNDADICPDPAPPAGPADCVPLKTGNLGTTVLKALNDRFGGCPVNNWPDYTKQNDPRNLMMLLTDYSALSGSGKTAVPVTGFADFYVIGWSGGPGACGTWPFPDKEPSGGNIWGYFVKYDAPGQLPSGTACRLDEILPCVAVMTR